MLQFETNKKGSLFLFCMDFQNQKKPYNGMNLNNKFYKVVLLFFAIISFSFQSASNENVEKLLKVNRTREITESLIQDVMVMYKKKYPNVSIMTWNSIEKSINYDIYLNKIKTIYGTNYTDAEIKELIKLYSSKTMDKYKMKTNKIEQKLYDIGKELGKELSILINSKIK
ncbi:hypothetical protein [Flavobacterium sp. UBA7682]|uniref:hypothetical protein n=1 Tax=Flavobacterium sp. UBA7682 TaxID=1946560 RepID=UPI0025C08693|nr:hypothetical protein [Flavobacterium sp. UBA7682]